MAHTAGEFKQISIRIEDPLHWCNSMCNRARIAYIPFKNISVGFIYIAI